MRATFMFNFYQSRKYIKWDVVQEVAAQAAVPPEVAAVAVAAQVDVIN